LTDVYKRRVPLVEGFEDPPEGNVIFLMKRFPDKINQGLFLKINGGSAIRNGTISSQSCRKGLAICLSTSEVRQYNAPSGSRNHYRVKSFAAAAIAYLPSAPVAS